MNSFIKSSRTISGQIFGRFKKEIENGKYNADETLPSYGALAESYGISKSTVHEAFKMLANKEYLYLKQGKGAFVNPAKIKIQSKTKLKDVAIIAFNIFSANDNYMIPFLEAINSSAKEIGLDFHFHIISGNSILSKENSYIKNMIIDNKYQGIIITSPISIKDIQWLNSLKIPFVMATSKYDLPIPQVLLDNKEAVLLAVEEFEKNKSKKILVFTGPLAWESENITPYAKDIIDHFTDLLSDKKMEFYLKICEYNYNDAKSKAFSVDFKANNYDAIFFQSDIIAKGVLAAFKEMDLDLNKITMINYCDLEEDLTPISIIKPLYQRGKNALEMLNNIYLKKEKFEKHILLKPKLKRI